MIRKFCDWSLFRRMFFVCSSANITDLSSSLCPCYVCAWQARPKVSLSPQVTGPQVKYSFYGTCTSSLITLTALHSTLSSYFFRRMVRNGIPRVCFYFCSTERNSELFSLPLKSSEGNSETLILFLFKGTEFLVVFSSAEGFGTKIRELPVPRNSRNSVGNNR
jgi:hypothetical protein